MRFCSLVIPFWLSFSTVAATTTTATVEAKNENENENTTNLRRKAYVLPDKTTTEEEPTRRVFVKYRPNMRSSFQDELNQRSSTTKVHYDFEDMDTFVLTIPESEVETMKHSPVVESVQDDVKRYPMHIPESVKYRNLQTDTETIPYGIDMVQAQQAWGVGARGQNVKVCVIDTGVYEHEDLSTITGPEISQLPFTQDGVGHGTHCAGTIAASENGIGVVGVAPEAEIYSIKVFSDRGFFVYSSGILAAAQECAAGGASIISMSLGGPLPNIFEIFGFNTLLNQGVISVAAAGNFGNGLWSFPASYPGVISVAAVDENKDKAEFSQFNSQVDIAAPGVDVLSTLPMTAPCQICDQIENYSYGSISGTSMACPHVAGVLALLQSFQPDADPKDYIDAIERSAEDLGRSGKDNEFGHGLIQAYAALEYLNGGPLRNTADDAATTSDDDCGSHEISFDLKLLTDDVASETSWELRNLADITNSDGVYLSGSGYGNNKPIHVQKCIPKSCYVFTMYDTEGDGICCSKGMGAYGVIVDGETVIESRGDFGSQDMVSFGECREDMYQL